MADEEVRRSAQLVGVFDSNGKAATARDALGAAGIMSALVHLTEPADQGTRQAALLRTLGRLMAPDQRLGPFHLAENPRHALVILDRAEQADIARAYHILNASGPVEVYRSG